MGTGASKNPDSSSHGSEEREDQGGGHGGCQLYIYLKMENFELKGSSYPMSTAPYPSSAPGTPPKPHQPSMERESVSIWELSFFVPPNHESLDFQFLLKPKYINTPCVVEEGLNRQLTGGTLQGDGSKLESIPGEFPAFNCLWNP